MARDYNFQEIERKWHQKWNELHTYKVTEDEEKKKFYVLNMSAQAAMDQINLKDYASKFALSGLPIVKVGINFDPERRTIGDWKIENA